MKDADTVKVGMQQYTVDRSDSGVSTRGSFGECYRGSLRINIDPRSDPRRQEQTFVHEIFEAIDFEYNVGLKHHQIELLELAVYQVAEDNPGLFEPKK